MDTSPLAFCTMPDLDVITRVCSKGHRSMWPATLWPRPPRCPHYTHSTFFSELCAAPMLPGKLVPDEEPEGGVSGEPGAGAAGVPVGQSG